MKTMLFALIFVASASFADVPTTKVISFGEERPIQIQYSCSYISEDGSHRYTGQSGAYDKAVVLARSSCLQFHAVCIFEGCVT
ncbi:MAG: hypothetical protein HYZ71_10575 [Deltaproteobacteria bacterium]|nr:hypothetical protein [Deltaproteobacteria bacterium]